MAVMAMKSAPMPEKIAPTTKYGPKMAECQPGCTVVAKIHEMMVCTETATGIMKTAITAMAFSSRTHCSRLPRQPRASRV